MKKNRKKFESMPKPGKMPNWFSMNCVGVILDTPEELYTKYCSAYDNLLDVRSFLIDYLNNQGLLQSPGIVKALAICEDLRDLLLDEFEKGGVK